MFYTNLVATLANLPALAAGEPLAPETWIWLPAIFLLGPTGMYLGIVAVRNVSASLLGPYTLLRLVVGLVGAVVIFHELPDVFSAIGAALILASCLLAVWTAPATRPSTWRRGILRHRK